MDDSLDYGDFQYDDDTESTDENPSDDPSDDHDNAIDQPRSRHESSTSEPQTLHDPAMRAAVERLVNKVHIPQPTETLSMPDNPRPIARRKRIKPDAGLEDLIGVCRWHHEQIYIHRESKGKWHYETTITDGRDIDLSDFYSDLGPGRYRATVRLHNGRIADGKPFVQFNVSDRYGRKADIQPKAHQTSADDRYFALIERLATSKAPNDVPTQERDIAKAITTMMDKQHERDMQLQKEMMEMRLSHEREMNELRLSHERHMRKVIGRIRQSQQPQGTGLNQAIETVAKMKDLFAPAEQMGTWDKIIEGTKKLGEALDGPLGGVVDNMFGGSKQASASEAVKQAVTTPNLNSGEWESPLP